MHNAMFSPNWNLPLSIRLTTRLTSVCQAGVPIYNIKWWILLCLSVTGISFESLATSSTFASYYLSLNFHNCRGISSTVRRCIEKETGREFAAKIIDLAMDSTTVTESTMNQMMEATRQEIAMLRHVMGHPYISEWIIIKPVRIVIKRHS